MSPFQAIYGRVPYGHDYEGPVNHREAIQNTQAEIIRKLTDQIVQERSKFKTGDNIYLRRRNIGKMEPRYEGPYKIIEVHSKGSIKYQSDEVPKIAHESSIKLGEM